MSDENRVPPDVEQSPEYKEFMEFLSEDNLRSLTSYYREREPEPIEEYVAGLDDLRKLAVDYPSPEQTPANVPAAAEQAQRDFRERDRAHWQSGF